MIAPNYDAFGAEQDTLIGRLLAGAIPTKDLPAAHGAHVQRLIAAGFGYDEASTAFWDAVSAARGEENDSN